MREHPRGLTQTDGLSIGRAGNHSTTLALYAHRCDAGGRFDWFVFHARDAADFQKLPAERERKQPA